MLVAKYLTKTASDRAKRRSTLSNPDHGVQLDTHEGDNFLVHHGSPART